MSTTSQKQNGPARTAILPSRGSVKTDKGNLNMDSNTTTAPKRQVLDYRDLESEMHRAVNMAEIACEQVEAAQCSSNKTASGYRIADSEMQLLSFAVYHASDLVIALKKKWDAVHDANVAAGSGRASA